MEIHSWIEKLNIVQMTFIPKLTQMLNSAAIKIPMEICLFSIVSFPLCSKFCVCMPVLLKCDLGVGFLEATMLMSYLGVEMKSYTVNFNYVWHKTKKTLKEDLQNTSVQMECRNCVS